MSKTFAYGGKPPGMAGRYHYGGGGMGVLGANIAHGGTNGDGYGWASVNQATDAGKEYYFPITSIPAGLSISVGEDTSFTASANDGTYVVPFDQYEWGVKLGSSTFTLNFGAVATINLTGANSTGSATSSAGAITVSTPAAAVINLAGAGTSQSSTSSTGAITVTAAAKTINLTGANSTGSATSSPGAISIAPPATILAAQVAARRHVVFPGGRRVVAFPGGHRVVVFDSSKT